MEQEFSSPLLENAVTALSRLPGVGRKTALRFALHLLRRPAEESRAIADAVAALRNDVRYCSVCHNISDTEL
ncbi:MAG: recombination protein RecR, partial [Muribaculaceae bacterium]|nr:recombination protein RecR [Muribaculaceae bacterium]